MNQYAPLQGIPELRQQIAKMGTTNAGKVLLHFEIRRNGKPINPINKLA